MKLMLEKSIQFFSPASHENKVKRSDLIRYGI
jgi:hypothetical protein